MGRLRRFGRASRRQRGVSGAQEALLFAPGGDYYPSSKPNPIPGLTDSDQRLDLSTSSHSINVGGITNDRDTLQTGDDHEERGQRHSSPGRCTQRPQQEEDDFVTLGRLRRERRSTVSRMGYIKNRLNSQKRHNLSISIEECGAEQISEHMINDVESSPEDLESRDDLQKESKILENSLHKGDATLKRIEAKIANMPSVKAERKRAQMSASSDQLIEDLFADVRAGDLPSLKVRVVALELEATDDFSLSDIIEPTSQLPILHVALMSDQQHIVEFLIEHGGLDVPSQMAMSAEEDEDGELPSPLHLALLHGNFEAMRLIVESVSDRKDRAGMINQVVIHEISSGMGKDELPLFSAVASCIGDVGKVRDTIEYLIENGADLALQTANGNTLLHLMVIQSAMTTSPTCVPFLRRIISEIFGELAAKWWRIKLESEEKFLMSLSFQECRIQALKYLLGIKNKEHQTPFTLAALQEAPLYIEFVRWENVIRFPDPRFGGFFKRTHTYDVTDITSVDSRGSYNAASVMHILAHNFVRLSDTREKEDILMIEPLRTIIKLKWSVYRWVFYTLAILHLTHMCAFTAVMFRHVSENNLTYPEPINYGGEEILPFVRDAVFLILPLIYLISGLFDHISAGGTKVKCPSHGNLLYRVVAAVFSLLTILWYIVHILQCKAETYVLCFTLLLGWIFLLFFTRGIILSVWNIQVGMFSSMLHRMFFFDVVPFAVMAFLVLISFSTAFHVLILQSSHSEAKHREYGVTLYLMVKYLVGLPNPQDHKPSEAEMLPKLMLVVYGLITVVLLINMLIASMNKSYEMIRGTKVNPVYRQRLSILLLLERRLPLWIRRKTQESFVVLDNPRTEKKEMFLKITNQL